jgi:hypothetical protein
MVRSLWLSVPAISRLGLVIAAFGVGADVVYHRSTAAMQVMSVGLIGHVVTLAGMFLALLGVVRAAAGSRRRARQKGVSNAARSSTTASR